MKRLKLIFPLILLAACTLIVSCSDGEKSTKDSKTETTSTDAKSGPEWTSAYICPMHCEGSGSDSPGTCPACEMEYVANADFKKDHDHGHDHNDHDGHDHSGHNH